MIDKVGEENINNFGSKMKILKYNNRYDILVEFENGYVKKCQYGDFLQGEVKSPYEKRAYGVGFLGEGKYENRQNNKPTKSFNYWKGMLNRCYNENYRLTRPTYKDCSMAEEWHNFQNFAKWYEENYYEIDGETMCLDKDILVKGNKIYSPETCIIVSKSINSLFVKRKATRGDYPIGVSYDKKKQKFQAQCNNGTGKPKNLGCYSTKEEAFNSYKKFKEKYIKQVADEYKDKIPKILYEAMYRYEVEITD